MAVKVSDKQKYDYLRIQVTKKLVVMRRRKKQKEDGPEERAVLKDFFRHFK